MVSYPNTPQVLDPANVVVGGFSFGGSTAGEVASHDGDKYRAAVFVDGWWKVNFPQYGIEVDLPKRLHVDKMFLPVIMFSSSEMYNIPNIREKQEVIKSQCPNSDARLMEGTCHGNFIDTTYWIPSCMSRFVNLSGQMIHPHKFYGKYIRMVADFMDKQCKVGVADEREEKAVQV